MRAFASDLDRTLIYSKTMLDLYPSNSPYEVVETLDGKEISYISLKTKVALNKLNNEMYFIPVTTRTISQYKRIQLFQNEIIPEYAVTSNGAHILKDGLVVQEWSSFIQEELKACLSLMEMIKKIEGIPGQRWIKEIRQADSLFIYLIIDRNLITQIEITELAEWAKNLGWQMSLQGRKLYFVPFPINKWKAVKFLCNELKITNVFTAGDSLLDYEMIINGHNGMAPLHGEVLDHYPTLSKTNSSGIEASEEIVECVHNRILLNS
ncbi:HAD family hydrolase [Bacillus sp. DJP31]|uniref:HAD family hydrolase n=1 Tax=Bacillus sp. DJP31 TaxID=3409789 RepID=UPI003BB4BC67